MIVTQSIRTRFVWIGILLAVCCGCVEVELELSLEKDGAGGITLIYSVSDQTVDRVKAAERVEGELAKAKGIDIPEEVRNHPSRLFLVPTEKGYRDLLEPYKKDGITITSLAVEARSARQYVELEVSFRDIASLQKLDFFDEYGFSLSSIDGGKYEVFREAAIPAPSVEKKKADKGNKEVSELMRDFDVVIRFNAPTRIDSSSASRQTTYVAEWAFNIERDPNAFTKLRQQDFKVVFAGAGVKVNEVKRQEPEEKDSDKADGS